MADTDDECLSYDSIKARMESAELEVQELNAEIVILQKQLAAATTATAAACNTWECGCGATNGVNLDHCGVCKRHRSEGGMG